MVKNIISSILRECPEVLNYLWLLDINISKDIFLNDSETLQWDPCETFVRFIKKIRELKLDYNIIIFISQA